MTHDCEGCGLRPAVTTVSVGRHLMDVCEQCEGITAVYDDYPS